MATGGSALNIERFAYDAIAFSLSKFSIDVDIPEPKCSQNNYEHPDFLQIISVGLIAYQLTCRDIWKPKFVTTFKSNRFRKYKQVSDCMELCLKELLEKDTLLLLPFPRALFSLAAINELIQFLHSKHCRLFVNELASFWSNYFAGFQEEFEREGGFSNLYEIHTKRKFRRVDAFIVNFIPKYCLPYGKHKVSDLFGERDSPRFCGLRENACLPDTQDVCDPSELDASFREKLAISSKSSRKAKSERTLVSDSLENTGLGIPRHEELIQECYSLPVVGDVLSKSDTESCVEGASAAEIQCPEEQLKDQSTLTGSPLNPEGQSKGRGSLTGSPLSPEREWKDRDDLAVSPLGTGRQLKGRGRLGGSPLSPEGQTKGRGGLSRSPLGPEGQSTGRGSLFGSPVSPAEKHRRESPRTPKGTSRLEQKRQKHLQSKRTEPSD